MYIYVYINVTLHACAMVHEESQDSRVKSQRRSQDKIPDPKAEHQLLASISTTICQWPAASNHFRLFL